MVSGRLTARSGDVGRLARWAAGGLALGPTQPSGDHGPKPAARHHSPVSAERALDELAALPRNPFPKRLRHLPRFDACPAVPHRGAAKAQLDARAIGELMGEIEALTEPVEHG